MGKVKTFKQLPPPPPPPPPPQPPQQQQQLTMPLVENSVITPNELIEQEGDKSINKKTVVKRPSKCMKRNKKQWKKSKKEQKMQLRNARVGRLLCPKSPLMVFTELFKDVQFYIHVKSTYYVTTFKASFIIDDQMYTGEDNSKTQAKQNACEKFLRCMLEKQIHKQSEERAEFPLNDEYELEDGEYVQEPKPIGLPEDDFPWSQFASLAMYYLLDHWKEPPDESTVIKIHSQVCGIKMFPKNPRSYNPTQLLNEMVPGLLYVISILKVNASSIFQVTCEIDDITFTGKGSSKKAAKKECCIAAIKHIWQFDFHAI